MPIPPDSLSVSGYQPNKRNQPTVQIVIDCKGQTVVPGFLSHAESLVAQLRGTHYVQNCFWVTRIDLANDYAYHHGARILRDVIGAEARHEPSFDLYEEGGIVPIARLVNVAPAMRWDDLETRQ
jgi:hypothetical protein